ncbi:MAG: hypothetical protein HZA08_08955 [Nitrospirae bacterium]|nr:hypothetical protein [Nitrospirota bacterium]
MSKSKKAREEEVVSEPKCITEIREELHADQARIAALDKEDVMDLSEQLVTCRYKLGFLVDCFIIVG